MKTLVKTPTRFIAFLAPMLVSLLFIFGVNGCDSVDTTIDCNQICNRYKDCIDIDYDTSACRNRCESNADDRDYSDKVNNCQTCIDERSCADSTFRCASECSNIVP